MYISSCDKLTKHASITRADTKCLIFMKFILYSSVQKVKSTHLFKEVHSDCSHLMAKPAYNSYVF